MADTIVNNPPPPTAEPPLHKGALVPPHVAIVRANRAAVDACDMVLAYVQHTGNTRSVVEYAEKKGKPVICLAK